MMTDPIGDMLTRVRNASSAGHSSLTMPASKTKVEIARILKDEGYILDYRVEKESQFDQLSISLKYDDDRAAVITGIKRISRPGLRVYVKKDELPRVLSGIGIAVISTSKGIFTNNEARRQGVGGEVLCYVW